MLAHVLDVLPQTCSRCASFAELGDHLLEALRVHACREIATVRASDQINRGIEEAHL